MSTIDIRPHYVPFVYFLDNNNKFSLGQLKREEYFDVGDYPIIDQGQEYIVGYSDEEDLVYTGKLPVIIFGDHTRNFKYVDFKFIQGADGIKVIKPNENVVNSKFFYYLLSKISVPSRGYNRHYSILTKQKYPLISKTIQDQIVAQIEPIEKKIKELKNKITPPQEVINKVFTRVFNFDLQKFEGLKRGKFEMVDFMNFNDYKLRCNFKANNYLVKYLLNFLKKKSRLLKDFLKESIISGEKPEYVENGKYRIVKTINVSKDGFINKFDDDKFIKETSKILEKNDILVTTHGEGRGKFGIYLEEEYASTDANCSIIKINQNKIDALYLNYYFNSFFGKELFYYLESETKSVRYMKNEDLENMPIVFDKSVQQLIVDEIKAELDKQEEIKQKIMAKRNSIDEIIEKAIA